MAATLISGPQLRSLSRDKKGHRDYTVVHLVEVSDTDDGPAIALACTGIPSIGDAWTFGNDSDVRAYCHPDAEVSGHQAKDGESPSIYAVEQVFSTRPLLNCDDIDDPLLQPAKVSGNFVKYTQEAQFDRFGEAITNSAFERVRGAQVEFDQNRPTVHIQHFRSTLSLATVAGMIDHLNISTWWGLPARTVKLSNFSWERLMDENCSFYYSKSYDFDIRYEGFDRTILDEGTKCLKGAWNESGDYIIEAGANANNPKHMIRFKDKNDENSRCILNGAGVPVSSIENPETGSASGANDPGAIEIEYYDEADFSLLGIPASLTS